MRGTRSFLLGVTLLLAMASPAFAQDYSHNTPGLGGYDPVAYFTDGKPMRGSGSHVTIQDGVTYAFTTEEHKKMFEANPQKYLPAYGGYCAYGVAVGKKIVIDPEAWKIVDGRLYLIMHKDIQKKWEKDIPGYIKKAEANWSKIKDTAPGERIGGQAGVPREDVFLQILRYREESQYYWQAAQALEDEAETLAAETSGSNAAVQAKVTLAQKYRKAAEEAAAKANEHRAQVLHDRIQ